MNIILIVVVCQLFCASLQGNLQYSILVDARARDGDLAFPVERVRNASGGGEIAIILTENASNLRPGAVLIVGRRFDNDCHASRRVTFVYDLVELLPVLTFTRAAFDRALDVIVRHTLRARSLDCAAQTDITIGIASAGLCRDSNLLRQFAEDFAALGVNRAFKPLDL